jgi:hypothetical protein
MLVYVVAGLSLVGSLAISLLVAALMYPVRFLWSLVIFLPLLIMLPRMTGWLLSKIMFHLALRGLPLDFESASLTSSCGEKEKKNLNTGMLMFVFLIFYPPPLAQLVAVQIIPWIYDGRFTLRLFIENMGFGNPPGFPHPYFLTCRQVRKKKKKTTKTKNKTKVDCSSLNDQFLSSILLFLTSFTYVFGDPTKKGRAVAVGPVLLLPRHLGDPPAPVVALPQCVPQALLGAGPRNITGKKTTAR